MTLRYGEWKIGKAKLIPPNANVVRLTDGLFAYREQVEAEKEVIRLFGGYAGYWSFHRTEGPRDSHSITFDIFGNEPDCASVRMEKFRIGKFG